MKNVTVVLLAALFVVIANSFWRSHSITVLAVGYTSVLYVLIQRPKVTWGLYGLGGLALTSEFFSQQHFGIQLIFSLLIYLALYLIGRYAQNTSRGARFSILTFIATFTLPIIITGEITPLIFLFPSLIMVWVCAQLTRYYLVSRSQESPYEII